MKYSLASMEESGGTKERILLVAVKLFSERGYAAVTVRDIGESANIHESSIYNHYKGKEALYDAIIEAIKQVYLDFYKRVDKEIERANSFKEVLDCLFAELFEVYDMFVYYGVTLITTEQFRNEKARVAFNDIYMGIGIDYSDKIFKECIQKKWVKEFDTRAMATMFMNSVLAGSLARTQEAMDRGTAYNPTEMFTSLRQLMLSAVDVI